MVSDFATIAIFVVFFTYVAMKLGKSPLTYVLAMFTSGILMVVVFDIVALLEISNHYVECIAGKLTAIGALVGILGLLTSLSMFPRRIVLHRALPSIYVISALQVIYMVFTPYFLDCDPVLGGIRGPFWPVFALWAYSLLIFAALIPLYNLLTSKTKVERLQATYMLIGTAVVIGYLGIAQIVPIYVEDFDAFSAVHALPVMGLLFTVALFKYGMYIVSPQRERWGHHDVSLTVVHGEVNAISDINSAYRVFRREISKYPGMVITLRPPEVLRKRYVMEKTPILWLTYFPSGYRNAIIPDRLHFEAMYAVINFVDRGGEIVMVDGVEYIIDNFGRRFFAEFLEELKVVKSNLTVILAVNSTKYVSGLADRTAEARSSIPDPRVIMIPDCRALRGKDIIVVTTRDRERVLGEIGMNAEIIGIDEDFNVDRLLFEGIKRIEESEKREIFIECMDHILSMGSEKSAMNFLKDVIDIILPRGGNVYIKYTPRAEEIPGIAQFIEGRI